MSLLQINIPEHFTSAPDVACRWALRDPAGNVLEKGAGPLGSMPGADLVEAVVPASLVLLARVRLPAAPRRKLLQLLPHIVEEKLMYEPETIHVAAGPQMEDGETAVAIIDKNWMRQVVGALRKAGLPPWRMQPETLMPEVAAGAWSVVWMGNGGFVRTGPVSGLALDGGNSDVPPLGLMLASKEAAAKGTPPQRIDLHLAELCEPPDLAAWSDQLGIPVSVAGPWDGAAGMPAADPGINLLQGEFAPAMMKPDWRGRLRIPAMMAGAILTLQLVGALADWAMLANEKRQISAEMQNAFRQAFPEARTVVNAPLQMRRNLTDLRHAHGLPDAGDFLPVLAKAAPLLFQPGKATIRSMQYDRGALKVELQLNGAQAPEQIKTGFMAAGLLADFEKPPRAGDRLVRLILSDGADRPKS